MSLPTQALRDEHQELLPHIEALRAAADGIDGEHAVETRRLVEESYAFLAGRLIPHAKAEDAALYPVVAEAMGSPAATATMARDHVEVDRLAAELRSLRETTASGRIDAENVRALRRVLYGLYALVKVHFAKEEEVYLPLLDSCLSPEKARQMFAEMERAAHEAKGHVR